jgi:hypothetical protein
VLVSERQGGGQEAPGVREGFFRAPGLAERPRGEQLGRGRLHGMTGGGDRTLVEGGGCGRTLAHELLGFSARDEPRERLFREDTAHAGGGCRMLPREEEPVVLDARHESDGIRRIRREVVVPRVSRTGERPQREALETVEELAADRGGQLAPLVLLPAQRQLAVLMERANRERRQDAGRQEEDEKEEGERAARDWRHRLDQGDSTGGAL